MSDPNAKLRGPAQSGNKAFPKNVDDSAACFSINLRPYSLMGGSPTGSGNQYIYLPMPTGGLNDRFNIMYDQQAMGAIGGVGASVAQIIRGDAGSIVGNVLGGIAAFGKNLAQSGAEAVGDLVGQGAQAGAAVDLASGFINNPNYAILFKGVKPREFSFSWTLVPKNIDESNTLSEIIVALKKAALPSRNTAGRTENFTLNYPYIAYLKLVGPEKDKMLTFSESGAFIQNIDVKYDGAGHAAFFRKTKDPARIDLTISFLERSIVTSEDIGGV